MCSYTSSFELFTTLAYTFGDVPENSTVTPSNGSIFLVSLSPSTVYSFDSQTYSILYCAAASLSYSKFTVTVSPFERPLVLSRS